MFPVRLKWAINTESLKFLIYFYARKQHFIIRVDEKRRVFKNRNARYRDYRPNIQHTYTVHELIPAELNIRIFIRKRVAHRDKLHNMQAGIEVMTGLYPHILEAHTSQWVDYSLLM